MHQSSMNDARVLIIDDDIDTAQLLTTILKPQGFTVYQAHDGIEGIKSAYNVHPDLVILDIMMPKADGWNVCARLRELSDVPILMLTARSAETDMLRGFALGTDDYMKKPFSKAELEARVFALLRRRKNLSAYSEIKHYTDPALKIDLDAQVVELDGQVVDLSTTEYSLLACLVRNSGRTVSHSELLHEVWGDEYAHMSATLTLYIHYLRKKLESPLSHHSYIRTRWGRGYCFVPGTER